MSYDAVSIPEIYVRLHNFDGLGDRKGTLPGALPVTLRDRVTRRVTPAHDKGACYSATSTSTSVTAQTRRPPPPSPVPLPLFPFLPPPRPLPLEVGPFKTS